MADGELDRRSQPLARHGTRTSQSSRRNRSTTSTFAKQMVGVSAGLIPFLEHDDANRALMGSNMQRQAVPLLIAEPPRGRHGLEIGSRPATRAWWSAASDGMGKVDLLSMPSSRSKSAERHDLSACGGASSRPQRTDLLQPEADHQRSATKVEKGQIIADGARHLSGRGGPGPQRAGRRSCRWTGTTSKTRSSSAKSWCKNDTYTSIHIEEFDIEIRETKLGHEEFTRDIPNVSAERPSATSTRTASSASARS